MEGVAGFTGHHVDGPSAVLVVLCAIACVVWYSSFCGVWCVVCGVWCVEQFVIMHVFVCAALRQEVCSGVRWCGMCRPVVRVVLLRVQKNRTSRVFPVPLTVCIVARREVSVQLALR